MESQTLNHNECTLWQQIVKKIKDFSELVAFSHSIFSLPFIFIAMMVAAGGWFGWKLLIFGIIATLSARNFAMAFNRLCDKKFDATNPRTQNRPSVDGRIGVFGMVVFIVINALIFIVTAYFVNHLAFMLSFPILLILASYSLMKRFSFLSHLILGLSLGLAPIAGVVAVMGTIPLWSWWLCLSVLFWVAGFDLLYALQDIEHDKKEKLYSIPAYFGVQKTLYIALVFHILMLVFWTLFIATSGLGDFMFISTALAAVMLGYEHYLVHKNFNNIPKAFFVVNGYLGIAFFCFCLVDFLLRHLFVQG